MNKFRLLIALFVLCCLSSCVDLTEAPRIGDAVYQKHLPNFQNYSVVGVDQGPFNPFYGNSTHLHLSDGEVLKMNLNLIFCPEFKLRVSTGKLESFSIKKNPDQSPDNQAQSVSACLTEIFAAVQRKLDLAQRWQEVEAGDSEVDIRPAWKSSLEDQRNRNALRAEQSRQQALIENLVCVFREDSGECSCSDKRTREWVEVTQEQCLAAVRR